MSQPPPCGRCGGDWFESSPDYGDGRGAQFSHYCSRTGSRVSCNPDAGEYRGMPELPEGYYARRREQLIGGALASHAPGCECMCCTVGRSEAGP